MAHSNSQHGLRIYPHWTPLVDPCSGGGASSPQYFYNFTSYRNRANGIFTKLGGDLHHINPVLIENGAEEVCVRLFHCWVLVSCCLQFFWTKFEGVDFSRNANIVNMLAVGHTNPHVQVDKVLEVVVVD